MILFTHRLLQIEPDGAYADVYVYSHSAGELYFHLYVGGNVAFEVEERKVRLSLQTDYPWDGKIRLQIALDNPTEFILSLRIPNWCRAPEIKIDGEPVLLSPVLQNGYAKLNRAWQPGDVIELDLPMQVQRVQAHPNVRANRGRVALQRGPLVYCLEEIDNGKNLNDLVLPREEKLEVSFDPNLLGSVAVITGAAKNRTLDEWDDVLYRTEEPKRETIPVRAIPYFAWDNREPGQMLVWIRDG